MPISPTVRVYRIARGLFQKRQRQTYPLAILSLPASTIISQAKARISAKVVVPLSVAGFGKSSALGSIVGVVPLLARIAGNAKNRFASSVVVPLLSRVTGIAEGLAKATVALSLAIRSVGVAKGSASPPVGTVPLFYGVGFALDPQKLGTCIVLSNGKLTATSPTLPSGDFTTVLSVSGQSSGKYYVEFTFTSYATIGDTGVGFANSACDLGADANGWLGFDSNSLGIYPFGSGAQTGELDVIVNSVAIGQYTSYATTAPLVMQMAVDLTNSLIWVNINNLTWNGSSGANPATGTGGLSFSMNPGPYFAGLDPGSPTDNLTINLGSSPYVYTPPSGFANWGNVSGLAKSSARGLTSGIVPVLGRAAGMAQSVTHFLGKFSLSTKSIVVANARATLSRVAGLKSSTNEMAKSSSAPIGVVPLLARTREAAKGISKYSGIVPLLARAVGGVAKSTTNLIPAIFLAVRIFASASGRIAFSKLSVNPTASAFTKSSAVGGISGGAALLGSTAETSGARSRLLGALPLFARTLGGAVGTALVSVATGFFGNGAIAKVPLRVYRIGRGIVQKRQISRYPYYSGALSLFATASAQAKIRANATVVVPLSSRSLDVAGSSSLLTVNLILKAIGKAAATSKATVLTATLLFATLTAQAKARISVSVVAALSARTSEQSEARASTVGKTLLSAYNKAMASGSASFPIAIRLIANAVGMAVARASTVVTLALTTRVSAVATARSATTGILPLLASVAGMARATTSFSGVLPLLARGIGNAAAGALIGTGSLIFTIGGIAKSPIRYYRIGRGLMQKRQRQNYPFQFGNLALFANTIIQAKARAASTGIVPLSARIREVSSGVAPLIANIALNAISKAMATNRANKYGIVPLLARVTAITNITSSFSGVLPLLGRTTEMAKGSANSLFPAILIYARSAGKAAGRIAFSKLSAGLSVIATGMGSGHAVSSGSLTLFARGFGQSANKLFVSHNVFRFVRRPFRIARHFIRKRQRQTYPFQFQLIALSAPPSFYFKPRTISYPAVRKKYSFTNRLGLIARTSSNATARIAAKVVTPLSAHTSGVAKSSFNIFGGILVFSRSVAMAGARATAIGTLKLSSRVAGAASGMAASSGVVPLLARSMAMAKEGSVLFAGILLYGRNAAVSGGRIVTSLAAPLTTIATAMGKGVSAWSGQAPLLARIVEIAKSRASIIGTATLVARGSAATSGRFVTSSIAAMSAHAFHAASAKASTIGTVTLHAAVKAIAVSRAVVGFGSTVALFAVAFGLAQARAASKGVVGFNARLSGMASSYIGLSVKVPLLARTAEIARSSSGLFTGILIHARGTAASTTRAAIKYTVPLAAHAVEVATSRGAISGIVKFATRATAVASSRSAIVGSLLLQARSRVITTANTATAFVLTLPLVATITSMAAGRAASIGVVSIAAATKAITNSSAALARGLLVQALQARGSAVAAARATAVYTLALTSIVSERASARAVFSLGKVQLAAYSKAMATSTNKFVAALPQAALSAMTFARASARSGFLRFVDPAFARIVSGVARFKVGGQGGPDNVSGSTD